MKQQLLMSPKAFFTNIFSPGNGFNIVHEGRPPLEVQYKMLELINVFLNLLSFNNVYINTLLFSFPVFAGSMALFKVFYAVYNKPLPAFCAFLFPSVLFWTSVVFKDGLFYMAIGYCCYYIYTGKQIFQKTILLLLLLAIMILSRANALITLAPAIFFLLLTEKKFWGKRRALGFTIAAIAITAIIFNAILPGGILAPICERQKDFQSLSGGSRIYLPSLVPTATSFLNAFPVAMLNGFFQPLPGAGGKSIYMAFSFELLLTWAIILYACCLLIRKKTLHASNFDIFCLLFALPGLILIGYMVPFAGAIIRYRSIYLPFLLVPFINILCSYPVRPMQLINEWLYRNAIAA